MRQPNETMQAHPVPLGDGSSQYATPAEVEAALAALTESDLAKLGVIATSFCAQRRLAPGAIEPEELLSEAILRTLRCEEGKRWNKKITLIKHLDRAMENISGHLVKQCVRLVPFSDGLLPDETEFLTASPEEAVIQSESALELINSVFGDDQQAMNVFVKRADGNSPREIQDELNLTSTQYETINRRILRIIAAFVFPTKA